MKPVLTLRQTRSLQSMILTCKIISILSTRKRSHGHNCDRDRIDADLNENDANAFLSNNIEKG